MKKYIYTFLISATVFCACSSDDNGGVVTPAEETQIPIDYASSTRIAPDGSAENEDAYTFMSYLVRNTSGVEVANPDRMTSTDYRGFYMFDASSLLRPVAVSATWPYAATNTSRNNGYGQKMNAGIYRTAILYPAVTVRNSSSLEIGHHLAVFKRTEDVYASYQDNVNLSDLTPRPFEMEVKYNLAVYDLPTDIKLYPTRSIVTVYFFSSNNVDYEILSSDLKLVNAGINGWYNAYTGKTYPNYGNSETVYSHSSATPQEASVINFKKDNDPADLGTVLVNSNSYEVKYLIEDEPVFAADYTGNNFYVQPLTLRVKLRMPLSGGGTADITSDLPLKLDMLRGKRYSFYVDVQSGMFQIYYSITNWQTENTGDGTQDIGEVTPYDSIEFNYTGNGNWVDENGSDTPSEIGG